MTSPYGDRPLGGKPGRGPCLREYEVHEPMQVHKRTYGLAENRPCLTPDSTQGFQCLSGFNGDLIRS